MKFRIISKLCKQIHDFVIFVKKKFILNQIMGLSDNLKQAAVLLIYQINACFVGIRESKGIIGRRRQAFANHQVTV